MEAKDSGQELNHQAMEDEQAESIRKAYIREKVNSFLDSFDERIAAEIEKGNRVLISTSGHPSEPNGMSIGFVVKTP